MKGALGLLILIVLSSGCIGDEAQVQTTPPPETTVAPTSIINSFEECAAAGYPVMESYPRQCRTPDGRTFVEELDEPIEPPDKEPPTTSPPQTTAPPTTPQPTEPITTEDSHAPGDEVVISETALPDCSDLRYTVAPVDLDEVYEITPLGSINPPGHTFPTEHMYLHISPGGMSDRIVSLRAPGDVYITAVTSSDDWSVPRRKEYTIDFSLCVDVHGYFNHVKELSDELESLIEKVECEMWTYNPGNLCSKKIFHKVEAGTIIGGVGHLQGNFDFGTYDHRTRLGYANPERYGDRSLEIACPLEYYDSETREELYGKILRDGEPRCGRVMQDVAGTLRGNWYVRDAASGGGEFLAFAEDNLDPSKALVSVGGGFSEAERMRFTPRSMGFVNRKFEDVTFDGNVYCYEGEGISWRIVVQMTSDTSLRIEHQGGWCAGGLEFTNPTIYDR